MLSLGKTLSVLEILSLLDCRFVNLCGSLALVKDKEKKTRKKIGCSKNRAEYQKPPPTRGSDKKARNHGTNLRASSAATTPTSATSKPTETSSMTSTPTQEKKKKRHRVRASFKKIFD